MHRPARSLPLVLAAALALTACGGGDPTTVDDTGDDAAAPDATDGDGAAAFPVTIEHDFGTTEVPAEPERVVTVGFTEQDHVLALGVVPVGTREYGGYDYRQRPWAQEALDGADIPEVGTFEGIDFEAVAALEPDLIVATYAFIAEDEYELLTQIAPTVAQAGGYELGGMPWDEQTLLIGEALGRSQEAETVVADVEAAFDAARDDHPEFVGSTLGVDYALGGGHYLLDDQDLRFRFFADLGFEAPETAGELSPEQTDLLEQDLLVVGGSVRDDLADDELFQRLDVVTENRTIFLGRFDGDVASALGFASPLSLPYALEQIVPALADAAAGEATADSDPTGG